MFNKPDGLMRSCIEARSSSAGLDMWSPDDFKTLLIKAFEWLAELLDLVEEGG